MQGDYYSTDWSPTSKASESPGMYIYNLVKQYFCRYYNEVYSKFSHDLKIQNLRKTD
jgi:hypothetical protein